jgi:anthranilate phosphoribosyltransferase
MTISNTEHFLAARFIKEIGRGKNGARSMSRDDAHDLYQAMLDGRVSDLELGGILLSMRIKGESVEEIAGFLDAAEAAFEPLTAPPGQFVPVLVHGVAHDAGRVATAEVFEALGVTAARDIAEAEEEMAKGHVAFITIDTLAPKLAYMLSLRRRLGVRNSTHTLVKIMQPFAGPALRLVSYTHPEYLEMLGEYFTTAALHERGDAFLMRGTEGETVANANKAQQIDWFHGGLRTTLVPKQTQVGELPVLPEDKDAATTAAWIASVLKGDIPVPPSIAEQVAQCLLVSRTLQSRQRVSEPIE